MRNHLPLEQLDPDLIDGQRDQWAFGLAPIALTAGRVILEIAQSMPQSTSKADGSPVTLADQAAEDVILKGLGDSLPWLTVIAEEQMAAGKRFEPGRIFALVDPLDGTKEFISRNGDYTVNIALIKDGVPVVGVIVAPARGVIWLGGQTAYKGSISANGLEVNDYGPIACRSAPERLTVVSSRSHPSPALDGFLSHYQVRDHTVAGSSLKFCLLAEGLADLYPRFGPTMEWDTAAGHAILRAAGGEVTTPSGADFLYGKCGDDWRNGDFVAYGDPRLRPQF